MISRDRFAYCGLMMLTFLLVYDKHKLECDFSPARIWVADKGFGFTMILVVTGMLREHPKTFFYTAPKFFTSDTKNDGLETPLRGYFGVSICWISGVDHPPLSMDTNACSRLIQFLQRSGVASRCKMVTSSTNLDLLYLGGGFKYFLFSPLFGEDSQFD